MFLIDFFFFVRHSKATKDEKSKSPQLFFFFRLSIFSSWKNIKNICIDLRIISSFFVEFFFSSERSKKVCIDSFASSLRHTILIQLLFQIRRGAKQTKVVSAVYVHSSPHIIYLYLYPCELENENVLIDFFLSCIHFYLFLYLSFKKYEYRAPCNLFLLFRCFSCLFLCTFGFYVCFFYYCLLFCVLRTKKLFLPGRCLSFLRCWRISYAYLGCSNCFFFTILLIECWLNSKLMFFFYVYGANR